MTSEPMLHDLTASEIVQRIRRKDLSAVELVRALLARIEELEPLLQSWVTVASEQALAEAEASDRAVAAGQTGPLQGVPVGVKDIIDVVNMPTTAGFTPFSERLPACDAAIVAGLRAAGAIMLGKTQTTQFAVGDPAPTENPWNRERTPGGSSAGSGAAVAARMVPAALGTQTAGSTLRPAAYCGVVGFKPSFNWISRRGVLPLAWSLDHVGLITRSVADLALFYGALTGGPSEPGTRSTPLRLALLTAYVERAEPAVQAHLTETAERLRAAGAEVVELELPVAFELIAAVHRVIMESEVAALHAENLARQTEHYGPVVRSAAEVGQLVPAAYALKARRLRRGIARQVAAALAGFDAFLLPTVSNVAPAPATRTTGDPSFQAPWTLLGMPAVTLPTGLNEEGLPIGAQLVGARGEDLALLAVAAWCADVLGTIALPEIEVPEPEPAWVPSPPPDLEFEPVAPAEAAAQTVADLTDDSEVEVPMANATTNSLPNGAGGVMLPGAKVGVTTPQGELVTAHGISGGVARPAARISSEPIKDTTT